MAIQELHSLGGVIRARRKELGWTQEELAERISALDEYVRQSDISRIERGEIMLPRRQRLARIASALNLPLGELLALSGWAGAESHFDGSIDWRTVTGSAFQPVASEAFRVLADDSSHLAQDERTVAVAVTVSRQHPPDTAKLGVTLDHFLTLSNTLRQRARELTAAREALSETRRLLPRSGQESDELNASA